MSAEAIMIWVAVGALAGWLAGLVVRGFGFGLLGNILLGILGAVLGSWLLNAAGIGLGGGLLGAILTAFIGAVVLLLIVRLVKRV